jgi:hypothetical protein
VGGIFASQLAAVREVLETAQPRLSSREIEELLLAVRRQHEDPEQHDRSLIAERLAWSPEQRLHALESFLSFLEQARGSRDR